MTTKMYFGCSRRVKGLRCGKLLTLLGVYDDGAEFICPDGHKKTYTLRYFQRFRRSLCKGQMTQMPNECPVCHAARSDYSQQVEMGLVQCSCGIYLVYNYESETWEVAETR